MAQSWIDNWWADRTGRGTSVSPSSPMNSPSVNSGLFYNRPPIGDNLGGSNEAEQNRVDNFGSGVNPYSKPGPITFTDLATRWAKSFSEEYPPDHLRPPSINQLNPVASINQKLNWPDRRRSNIFPDAMRALTMPFLSRIPGSGLLMGAAKILNQMGAHHDFNPARDSNLFYETDRGRMTWDSMDPGGGGEQMGSLNAYVQLMNIAANDPDREIQTQAGWVKVGDLAESMKSGEFYYLGGKGNTETKHTKGLFTEQPTNFDQMPSDYESGGERMSNEDALRSLETRHGDAWNAVASQLNPDGTKMGYDEQVAAAAKAEQMLRGQRDSTKLVPQETSETADTTDGDQSVVNRGDKRTKMGQTTQAMRENDFLGPEGVGFLRGKSPFISDEALLRGDHKKHWENYGTGLFFGPEEEDPFDRVNRLSREKVALIEERDTTDKEINKFFRPKEIVPGLDPFDKSDIHKTVIQIESGGDKDARGSDTERGEYQVRKETLLAPGFMIKGIDPKLVDSNSKEAQEERTRIGKEYLDVMLEIFSDSKNPVATALVAFNRGPFFARDWEERGGNLFELGSPAIGYLQKFHDANPDYINIETGKELTPSGSEMSLPDIVELPPQLKKPAPLSVLADTTSSDSVDAPDWGTNYADDYSESYDLF